MSQRTRAYLYRIATAAGALAVGYGLIGDSKWPLWAGLAVAVFGTQTAASNTPRRGHQD